MEEGGLGGNRLEGEGVHLGQTRAVTVTLTLTLNLTLTLALWLTR